MARKITTSIENFDGAMAADPRDAKSNQVGNVEHFLVEDKKLVPLRSTEAVEDKSLDITKFSFSPNNTDYSLYGFGLDSGVARVYEIAHRLLFALAKTSFI